MKSRNPAISVKQMLARMVVPMRVMPTDSRKTTRIIRTGVTQLR